MPRVYLSEQQRKEAQRQREVSRLKKLVSINLQIATRGTHLTQEALADKYGTSAPSLRKVQRCEDVRFPYDGFLNLLLDSGLTIVEAEQK